MLEPVATVTPEALAAGQRALVRDLAWASMSGAFCGGVILVAFALSLGASPVMVGLLAAIPYLTQAAQLPATLLVERLRQRRKISVLAITTMRVLIMSMAFLPFLPNGMALAFLVGSQVLIAALNAVGACAVNSWLHQLIPHEGLGQFFARRLFSGTTLACLGTLGAGALVDNFPPHRTIYAYALSFGIAGLTGFVSSYYLSRAPEPVMFDGGPAGRMLERLREPFRDANFRSLLLFLGSWTVAANLAAPFITVYLMQQRGFAVGTVTSLWVTSQLANALTLYLWGRLSDRLTNKAVLAVALPVYFACVLALCFADEPQGLRVQLAILYVIHFLMGVATGGIGLATGNLGLKLAPQGQGTVYLAAIGLVSAVAGGAAPIVAGFLAEALEASQLSAVMRFTSPTASREMLIVSFAHWEFLFAIAAMCGLYVMHALSRVREGDEVSERQVMQEFGLEAVRSLNNLSSTALGTLFPFERLSERRKWWRPREARGR